MATPNFEQLLEAGCHFGHLKRKWNPAMAPYIFMVGSILIAVAQFFSSPKTDSVNIRRLHRQQMLGALLLVATGPLMIFLHGNEWIVSLTLAAIIELFTSIRLPQEEEKEKNQRSVDGH